jgi:hypothetical protein
VYFSFEHHGGIHEDFREFWEGFLNAIVEKKIDDRFMAGNLAWFVHGGRCFGLSTFSI